MFSLNKDLFNCFRVINNWQHINNNIEQHLNKLHCVYFHFVSFCNLCLLPTNILVKSYIHGFSTITKPALKIYKQHTFVKHQIV